MNLDCINKDIFPNICLHELKCFSDANVLIKQDTYSK